VRRHLAQRQIPGPHGVVETGSRRTSPPSGGRPGHSTAGSAQACGPADRCERRSPCPCTTRTCSRSSSRRALAGAGPLHRRPGRGRYPPAEGGSSQSGQPRPYQRIIEAVVVAPPPEIAAVGHRHPDTAPFNPHAFREFQPRPNSTIRRNPAEPNWRSTLSTENDGRGRPSDRPQRRWREGRCGPVRRTTWSAEIGTGKHAEPGVQASGHIPAAPSMRSVAVLVGVLVGVVRQRTSGRRTGCRTTTFDGCQAPQQPVRVPVSQRGE
jgi:hypothetical protein